jgi:hypothetical protein
VIFTSTYFGIGIIEVLDDTQFLDSAILMNNPPAAFEAARPVGKGPLWFAAGVTLIDHNVSSPRGGDDTKLRRDVSTRGPIPPTAVVRLVLDFRNFR